MPKYLLRLIVAWHLLAFTGEVIAETITHSVAVKKINQTLAAQFPFSKSFKALALFFLSLKLLLMP